MLEKKYKVRAECPFRVCGLTSRPSPEVLRSKFTPRPLCGKKVKNPDHSSGFFCSPSEKVFQPESLNKT